MIDDQYLKQLSGNDTMLHRQLLQQFIETTEDDLQGLQQAINKKELSNVKHFAHRIKGSAQLLSISALVDMADVLENSSESLLDTTLQARYQQLYQLFSDVKQHIQSQHIQSTK